MKIDVKHQALWSVALALALFGGPSLASAQNQSARTDDNVQSLPGYPVDPPAAQAPDSSPSQQQSQEQAPEAPAPGPPQTAPAPPRQFGTPPTAQSAPPAQPTQPVPAQLTLPSGTIVPVRITGWLSSEQNHPGDTFSASLDQPLVVNGWVVARKGQTVIGRVTTVRKAGHFGSMSELGLELSMLTLIDGQQISVQSKQVQNSGRSTAGPDAATVGVTTGVGAAVGAAADGGYGAGLGAGIGAMVGLAGVMTSHGSPTVVRPETLLTFQLGSAIAINTEQSRVAFQPVRPSDYRADQDAYAPANRPSLRGRSEAYPPPAVAYPYPYPYYPYYDYGWGYPGPVIGLGFGFGGYGYGRGYGFYGRGYGGRGFRR
jgi:hypothetical protein